MACYPHLLLALMTASLLQTSVVLAQDVLTITTSSPYVFNGTLQYDLTCTISPLKAMTFRWEYIDCNQREKLLGGDRCTFTPSQFNNGMTVMCTASYGTNSSSSEISNVTILNVQYPPSSRPEITSNILGGTMYVGQNYYFFCTIAGGNPLPSVIFGCAPTSPFHQGVPDWRSARNFSFYNIKPAVLSDDGVYCKCTGYWFPFPAVYQLDAHYTFRAVDLNGSTVLPINRTTLPERTSTLSASETLTFTTRTSSLTSSETPILDNQPDDHFKSNVFIGFGIIGVLLLACIIIGIFGLRVFLSKREKKPEQNCAVPCVGPNLRAFAESGHNYDSIPSLQSDRSSLPLYNSEIRPDLPDPENELYLTPNV